MEARILTFMIHNEIFGINVTNVNEIIRADYKVALIPHSNPRVIGSFQPRDKVITAIDLTRCLFNEDNVDKNLLYKINRADDEKKILRNKSFIIYTINDTIQAWFVDEILDIKEIDDCDIIQPSAVLLGKDCRITGIINDKINNQLIQIVDCDKILQEI